MALSRTAPAFVLPHPTSRTHPHSRLCAASASASAPSTSRTMLPPLASASLGAHSKAPSALAALSVATATAVPATLAPGSSVRPTDPRSSSASYSAAPVLPARRVPRSTQRPQPMRASTPASPVAPRAIPIPLPLSTAASASGASTPESLPATPPDTQVYGSSPAVHATVAMPRIPPLAPFARRAHGRAQACGRAERRGRSMERKTSHVRGGEPGRFSTSPSPSPSPSTSFAPRSPSLPLGQTPTTTATAAPVQAKSTSPTRGSAPPVGTPSPPTCSCSWGQDPILVTALELGQDELFAMDMGSTTDGDAPASALAPQQVPQLLPSRHTVSSQTLALGTASGLGLGSGLGDTWQRRPYRKWVSPMRHLHRTAPTQVAGYVHGHGHSGPAPVRLAPPIPPSHRASCAEALLMPESPQRQQQDQEPRGRRACACGRGITPKILTPAARSDEMDVFPVPVLYQSGW